MSLVHINVYGKGSPVNLSEISLKQNIDSGYLEQIFIQLKKAQLVSSVRGAKGGYVLLRDAKEILLTDIMTATLENLRMTRCAKSSHEGCLQDKTQCLTHGLWTNFEDYVHDFLSSISIQDICDRKFNISNCGGKRDAS
jgi:Rrf2 family iron-sulfur cluster assembly transcriptional regulator